MSEERKHYSPEEKVAILHRHLVEEVPVSAICEHRGLSPNVFYRWQKELFENGAAAFRRDGPRQHRRDGATGGRASRGAAGSRAGIWFCHGFV